VPVSPSNEQTSTPSLTPVNIPEVVPPSETLPPTDTSTPTPQPEPAYVPPQYLMDVTVDYDAHIIDVIQQITYTNSTGQKLETFTLAVVPNQTSGVFELQKITIDDKDPSKYELTGQKLEITSEKYLAPGASTQIDITYRLNLPAAEQGDPNIVRPAIFGYTSRQTNLTDWYPMILPHDPKTGWLLNKPGLYGEHLVYPRADYDVILRFRDIIIPVVAASGELQYIDSIGHYILKNGRAFAISMSRDYQTFSAEVDGVTITSYFFPIMNISGQAALDATVQAYQTYTGLFGPYHHKTLAVVQGDFNDGMEFDGLYFLSNAFYNLYDGSPKNYLILVAAHETCHQWWFGRVASDQANEPWMDEAISTYCEKLFYETNYPELVQWWWSYRIDYYQPSGYIDVPLYDSGGFTPYTNAVYRMGAHFYQDLRTEIGDEAFFAFLKDYSTQMDGKIATSADFFRILRQHTDKDLTHLLAEYFRNPK
jgi:aminopeptidase N